MKLKQTLIIIPTFNEAKNINKLICQIFNGTNKNNIMVDILIIDDNSIDNTIKIVNTLKKNKFQNNLFLINRFKKKGLGTAYIDGFKWGLKKNYKYFIQMDADFSHDPIYLKKMFELINDYDFVIGSRYINNSKVIGQNKLRKTLSHIASLYSKIILRCPIKDLTGGFNIWKREVLLSIDLNNIESIGFCFQIELKYKAFKKGYKFKEFPIIFKDRTKGKSKFNIKIIIEAIFKVLKIRIFNLI